MIRLHCLKKDRVRVLFEWLIMVVCLLIDKLVESRLVVRKQTRCYLALVGVETEECDHSDHANNEENAKGTCRTLVINSDYLLIQVRAK
jgi:hypothetical protein